MLHHVLFPSKLFNVITVLCHLMKTNSFVSLSALQKKLLTMSKANENDLQIGQSTSSVFTVFPPLGK